MITATTLFTFLMLATRQLSVMPKTLAHFQSIPSSLSMASEWQTCLDLAAVASVDIKCSPSKHRSVITVMSLCYIPVRQLRRVADLYPLSSCHFTNALVAAIVGTFQYRTTNILKIHIHHVSFFTYHHFHHTFCK